MNDQMCDALRVYVDLVEEYESFDRADCTCDYNNFHVCRNCHESGEAMIEMRRHFANWGERFAWELAKQWGLTPKTEAEEAQEERQCLLS